MKVVATGHRHEKAEDLEIFLLGYAHEPGTPWQDARTLPHDAQWELVDEVNIPGVMTTALLSRGGALILHGRQPLLLFLMHPWSGIVRLHVSGRILEVDLYSETTHCILLDAKAGVVVEPNLATLYSSNKLLGTAVGGIDMVPEAIRFGRLFFIIAPNLREIGWLSPLRWTHRVDSRGRNVRRSPFLEIGLGLSWLMSRLNTKSNAKARENILWAVLEGLVKRGHAWPGQAQGGDSDLMPKSMAEDQIAILNAMVDGLMRRVDTLGGGEKHVSIGSIDNMS